MNPSWNKKGVVIRFRWIRYKQVDEKIRTKTANRCKSRRN